mgnify:FL=1
MDGEGEGLGEEVDGPVEVEEAATNPPWSESNELPFPPVNVASKRSPVDPENGDDSVVPLDV